MKRGHVILATLLFGTVILWNACSDDDSAPLSTTATSPQVVVAGGTSQMGYARGSADQGPGHLVTLSDFPLDKYEVTVAEYRAFCSSTGRTFPSASS
jgi:formylglycine-generating enzyme required for sulfatase activity